MEEATPVVTNLTEALAVWRHNWPILGNRFARTDAFWATLPPQHPDKMLIGQFVTALADAQQHYESGLFTTNDLEQALTICDQFEKVAMKRSGWDAPGGAYGAIHSLKNVMNRLQCATADIEAGLTKVVTINLDPNKVPLWQQLQNEAADNSPLTINRMSHLQAVCERLQGYYPSSIEQVRAIYPLDSRLGSRIFLLVVEDDPAWLADDSRLPDIRQTVERVAAAYRHDREVHVCAVRTYKDALNALQSLASPMESWSVIVVLDLGIPEDAGELARIEANRDTVGRQWGRLLLKHARDYQNRYRVIICTTETSYAEDHRLALACGIAPHDYILKRPGALEALEQSLHQTLAPRAAPRLEILAQTGCLVRLDDHEVEINPAPFRSLCVLAQYRHRSLTINEIAGLLPVIYPEHAEEYNQQADADAAVHQAQEQATQERFVKGTPGFQRRVNELLALLMAPVNAQECWEKAQKIQSNDAEKHCRRVINAFYSHCCSYTGAIPWHWFLSRFGLSEECIAHVPGEWNDSVVKEAYAFASKELRSQHVRPKSFNPASIHDHIYHIRQQLYAVTGMDIERYVLKTRGDGYQLIADAVLLNTDEAVEQTTVLKDDTQCRVLATENEEDCLRDIINTLSRANYSVQGARTIQDAVALANTFTPHILCLDLDLPRDQDELSRWETDPTASRATGGLDVLRQVQEMNPRIKSVILSGLANEGAIRVAATRLGISIHAIINKGLAGSVSWRDELLRAVWQCEKELRRGVLLPPSKIPFVQVRLEDRGSRDCWAFVSTAQQAEPVPVKMGRKEFEVLKILREVGDRPTHRDTLIERLYGEDWPDKIEAFKQALKRARQAIVDNGIGLSGEHAREVRNSLITELDSIYLVHIKIL